MLQRLLILPLLAPLLAVLLVAALNPRPNSSLRLLIWSTPALPIGAWLALAAGGGAALSAALTALALQPGEPVLRRRLRRESGPWPQEPFEAERRREPDAPRRETAGAAWSGWPTAGPGVAGPERGPHEPAPTVAVPFRVIRRGRSGGRAEPVPTAAATPGASAGGDAEGWDIPLSDDW